MGDFTPYGSGYDEALNKLEKVLKHCIQTHLYLSIKKFHMMKNEGIVLGHYHFVMAIQVDPS